MKLGSRATFAAIPRKTIDIDMPELDCAIRLREMSGTDRDRFEVAAFKEAADGKRSVDPMYLRARMVALCMVDETGERIYADDEIHMLSDAVPASVLGKLFEAVQKLNGLDSAATEAAAKNSESVPAGASTSDLHWPSA